MTTPTRQATQPSTPSDVVQNNVRLITDALRGIRFGSVEIIVQDARIVQIQRLEKNRLV